MLFCFVLNPTEACKIDPAPDCYLDSMAASGSLPHSLGHSFAKQGSTEDVLELPAGLYAAAQIRCFMQNKVELTEAAIELQKEALWTRNKMENTLYVRRLFEDDSPVTQLLRPVVFSNSPL